MKRDYIDAEFEVVGERKPVRPVEQKCFGVPQDIWDAWSILGRLVYLVLSGAFIMGAAFFSKWAYVAVYQSLFG